VDYDDGRTLHELYDGRGTLLGVHGTDGWHPAFNDGWLKAPQGEPPVPPPPGGVDWAKVPKDRPRYWLNGMEVPAQSAYDLLDGVSQRPRPKPDNAPDLPDETGKCHLTVVGPGLDRAAALAALGSDAGKVLLQVYAEPDWPVRYGRVKPGVTLQAPAKDGGKVRFHSGATTADAVAEALKYADPDYRPVAPEPKPVAPAPAPKVPAPAPAPRPCPPDCPCPGPEPIPAPRPVVPGPGPDGSPTPPTPAPAAGGGSGLTAMLLALVYLIFPRRPAA
jgi:hypothetical protein